jgi:hypothetical protein
VLNPHGVGQRVQQREAVGFGDLLRPQQLFPPERRHGFVALDAPEAGVAVAQVAEAGDADPLQRALAGLIARRYCRLKDLGLQLAFIIGAR